MTYKLQVGCTVDDAEGVAKNNVPAFWSNTWWRILYDAPAERVLEVITLRTPWNLLSENEVKRHQVVLDSATGDIVGYARWMLPTKHQNEWLEAKTPEPSKEEIQRFKDLSDNNRLPHGDPQFKREMDALDDPIEKAEADFAPKKPYIKLAYLATHIDHHRRGISSMLVKSGLEQADRLGLDVLVIAMGYAATALYKKLGFEMVWDLEQTLKPWGHDDVYYTAILIRRAPVKE